MSGTEKRSVSGAFGTATEAQQSSRGGSPACATPALRFVHRGVGAVQEVFGRLAGAARGDADARGDRGVFGPRRAECFEDRVGGRRRDELLGRRQDGEELVAAEPT